MEAALAAFQNSSHLRPYYGGKVDPSRPSRGEMWDYINQNDLKSMNILLQKYPFVIDQPGPFFITALHEAVRRGYKAMAEYLMIKGANVNVRDQWGQTPLFIASWRGQVELAELLLKHGADVTIKDNKGRTAPEVAGKYFKCDTARRDAISLLLKGKKKSLEDAREHDQEFTAMQADSTAEPESEGESLIIEPTLYMEQSEELRDGDIYSFLEGSG